MSTGSRRIFYGWVVLACVRAKPRTCDQPALASALEYSVCRPQLDDVRPGSPIAPTHSYGTSSTDMKVEGKCVTSSFEPFWKPLLMSKL
jgi:hypothetical protein